MPYRCLERRLGLLGGGLQYTPRRRDVPCRDLERRLSLLGVEGMSFQRREINFCRRHGWQVRQPAAQSKLRELDLRARSACFVP